MPAKLSLKEVQQRFAKRAPEYQLLGEYKNSSTKVLVRHQCGHEYLVTPLKFWSGDMCPKCNKELQDKKKLAQGAQIFFDRLKAINMELCEGEEYCGQKHKIKVRCLQCGRVQSSWGSNILSGHGCQSCQNSRPMAQEDFIKKLTIRAPDWELVGEYKGATTPTLFRHKKCGKIFERTPDWVCFSPNKCNRCARSSGETAIVDSIVELLPEGEDYLLNNRTVLEGKELDLYIPRLGIAFEYDGVHYHSEGRLASKGYNPVRYHLQKTLKAQAKGVRVVHIFEDEWLEHPELVKDKIRAILKMPFAQRYYARQSEAREISAQEAKCFLQEHHIQGGGKSRISVGLFLQNELVAVQTFAYYTSGKANEYELTRYATKIGTQVVGGFSKCLKYFERNYRPAKVVSFADRRWSAEGGNVYTANGFSLSGVVPPNYWYTKRQERFHKFGFRKALIAQKFPEIYSPEKTEKQMMQEAGFERIYDCGLLRYEKVY